MYSAADKRCLQGIFDHAMRGVLHNPWMQGVMIGLLAWV